MKCFRRFYNLIIALVFVSFLSCSTTILKIDYVGNELDFDEEYSISQATNSMLMLQAPANEEILVNMYNY